MMDFHLFSCRPPACRLAMRQYVITAAASCSFLISLSSYAAEPWADRKLPVRDGLELCFDASHAAGDQSLPADGKLKQWRDASGKNRHLETPKASDQPSLITVGNAAIVRFDGIDDQFR